ncbi:MAG: cell division protein FtsA [candidate division KSB1 bacterium]|nr:cell division protein FtsA [candidate division KSB1 bacterium]MDZ7294463.1 cell division protein FtsA [candidate division KSB1 bacterium]MDZ7386236.1 cell division protein FtsA [candidate division KSB1 bacterium]MDZ7393633.1 cell division protein FtsA [candidate division KSB1 bacterium]MDZ7413681.1 cell division protein FtsA [candidate division KSB1 bacterium]
MEYIASLDVGTTKVAAIIAEVDDEENVNIVGVGTTPCEGLRHGMVVNLERTVLAIAETMEKAEQMAGVQAPPVVVGIAGPHIRGINGRGVVAVSGPDREITPTDVERVIAAAQAMALPSDRELIHIIRQEFVVDEQRGIKDPVGLCGVRLEAEVYIVTAALTALQNLCRSIEKAGYQVGGVVLESLASAYAVMAEQETEQGGILLDLGGGTTDIAVFFEGSLRHTASVTLGGRNVTSDLAYGLRTSLAEAERIKVAHGSSHHREGDKESFVEVTALSGQSVRKVSKAVLVDIIQPRMEEILTLAHQEVQKCDYSRLAPAGVVVTGGGATLEGTLELCEEIFGAPARLGVPQGFSGLTAEVQNPAYATAVGLILYQVRHPDEYGGSSVEGPQRSTILRRLFDWLRSR